MASTFALRERALNEKLFTDLIGKVAAIAPETENFAIALQFCLRNTAQHTYLDTNPSTVDSQYKELLKRLEINAQLRKAEALEVLTAKFRKQKFVSHYSDVNASILSLLYNLADAPASRPLDFEPRLFQDTGTGQGIKDGDDSESVESEWSYNWSTESDLKSDAEASELELEEFSAESEEDAGTDLEHGSSTTFDWKTFSLDLSDQVGQGESVDGFDAEQTAVDSESTLIEAISRSRGRGLAFLQPNGALRTTEVDLIRQVLHLLQGTVQRAFFWHHHGFQLVAGVHVSHLSMSSLRHILAPFLSAASSLKRIQVWVDDVRSNTSQSFGDDRRQARGPTVEAFANALLLEVQSLLTTVSDVETQAARGAAGTQVTLLSLRQTLRRVFARSQFLEKVLDAVTRSDSGSAAKDAEHLLSVLYWLLGQHCLVEDGEEAAYCTVLSLFLASLQPMLDSLDAWLEEGVLQDSANELFICANTSIPIEDSAFWLLGHSLRRRRPTSPPPTDPPGSAIPATVITALPPFDSPRGQAAPRRASFNFGQSSRPTSDPSQVPPMGFVPSTPAPSQPPEDDLICPPFLTSLATSILRTGKSLQLLNHVTQDHSSELARPSAGPFPRTSFPFFSPSRSPFQLSAPPSPGLKPSNPSTPPDARFRRTSLVSQLPSPTQRSSPLRTPLRSSPSVSRTPPPEPAPPRVGEEVTPPDSAKERPSLYEKFCGSLRTLVSTDEGREARPGGLQDRMERPGALDPLGSPHGLDASVSSKWSKSFVVEDWLAALKEAATEAHQRTDADAPHGSLWQASAGPGENGTHAEEAGEKRQETAMFTGLPPLDDEDLQAAFARNPGEETSTSGREEDGQTYAGSDYASGRNGGALVVESSKSDVGRLMQGVVRDPTWLPPFTSGMDVFVRGARDGAATGDALRWLRGASLKATPAPAVLIQECLLTHISKQIDHVGARLLSRLMGEWQLIEELAILRAIYLMGSGDVLHQFTAALFTKLERKEPWDDFYELNTMLQSSVRASGDSALSLVQDSLTVRVVDPAGEAGSDAPSYRPTLRSFGIDALDALRFSYKVSWPLELIISEAAIRKYNQVMAFLLKVKRAKHGLDRASRWKINGMDSSRNKQRLLFQQKLLHFINTLHQYVMDRVLYSAWLDLRTEMGAAGSLDEVIACHERYLAAIQKQCLVASDKLWTLLASRVRTMISIALDFCSLQRTLASDGINPDVLARCEAEVQRLERQFHESMVFLLRVLSSRLNVGHFPHLADLVIRINYNHYYVNEHGRIFSPPAVANTHHL